VSLSNSGDWILTPSNDLTTGEMRAGVEALEQAIAGGPETRIAAALMRLISATRRPAWMDDEIAEHYFEALQEAMLDYPIDLVEAACVAWRKGQAGEFWPAEKELRRLCDDSFKLRRDLRNQARSMLGAMESYERGGSTARSHTPFGATQAFVEACMASHGPNFVRSHLTHRTCDFNAKTVFTFGFAAERIMARASGLAEKHGVTIKVCPDTTRRVYADIDAQAPSAAPKRRKP
jgi:hypothetical protein